VDGDSGRVGARGAGLSGRPSKGEALRCSGGVDSLGAAAAGPGSAAAAFGCELPVRSIGLLASLEQSVGCATITHGCRMTTAIVNIEYGNLSGDTRPTLPSEMTRSIFVRWDTRQ
jgi:hypothetical protein